MRMDKLLRTGIIMFVVGLIGLVVTAMVVRPWTGFRRGPMGMMRGLGGRSTPGSFTSNGERIYYTATSDRGEEITFSGGPMWLRMHGGSCVTCHGEDGKGGIEVPMTSKVSPDIRYDTLTSSMHMTHDGEEHPPYTDTLIKRAITRGVDPAGNRLDWVMPRWQMSESDLDDLVSYLKTL